MVVPEKQQCAEKQKRAEAIGLTPDGGIDDDGGAEKIGKRDKKCAFFTELFAGEHPKCRGAGDVRQNGRELYHERIALRVLVDTEQAAERLNDVEHVEIAGGIIEEEVPVIHVIKAVIVRIGGPRFKAGDVGLEPVDVVAQNKAQDKPQSEHGAEDGHGGQAEDRSFLYTGAADGGALRFRRGTKAEPQHCRKEQGGEQNLYRHGFCSFLKIYLVTGLTRTFFSCNLVVEGMRKNPHLCTLIIA